jgi:hypothetical protein
LRDHTIRLRNWRGCHGLRRCCNGKGKASYCNQPNHSSPPSLRVTHWPAFDAGRLFCEHRRSLGWNRRADRGGTSGS